MARGSSKSDFVGRYIDKDGYNMNLPNIAETIKSLPEESRLLLQKERREIWAKQHAEREAKFAKNEITQAKRRATLAAKKAEKERPAKEAAELQRRADMDPKSPWTEEQLDRRRKDYHGSTSGFYGIEPTFGGGFGDKPFAPDKGLEKLAESSPDYKTIKDNFKEAAALIKAITEYQEFSFPRAKRAVLAAWRSAPESVRKLVVPDGPVELWRGGRPEGKPGRPSSVQSFTANPSTAMNFGKNAGLGITSKYDRDVESSEAIIDTRKFYNLMRNAIDWRSTSKSYMGQSYLDEKEYLVIKPKFKKEANSENPEWVKRAREESRVAFNKYYNKGNG